MKYLLTFGGWYQRTTLHLTEVYDFFKEGKSYVTGLDPQKLQSLVKQLDLVEVSRQAGHLEYVQAHTRTGITIRYYEDGLYILEKEATDIKQGQRELETYFHNLFSPAISYIFSQGAPTPKVLANIQPRHPTVVGVVDKSPAKLDIDTQHFGKIYSQITADHITVYKLPGHIFVATTADLWPYARDLIEMQIFFREFKDQLGKYLAIHRTVWEAIAQIKEQKEVTGRDIGPLRARLDSYQKTVNLISNRINQMGTYVHTRASLSKQLKIEDTLKTVFEYKFETLSDTLSYIKELWSMTRDYLAAAIRVMVEIEDKSLNTSIRSLQILTSVGVITGILGYLARTDWPKVTRTGLWYLAFLVGGTWLLNLIIAEVYRGLKYKIKITDTSTTL